jgi:uncharacterized membrane protein YesL
MSRRGGATAGASTGLLGGLDGLLHRAVQLVWLNLWWTLFTLRGGILLGIGPATVGAHAVASAWARSEEDVDVPRTMADRWRRTRRPASAAGLLALALLTSLTLTWWLSRSQGPVPAAVTQGLVLLAVVLLATALPYLAVVIERTADEDVPRLRLSRLFLTGLALGMSRPVLTAVLIAIWLGWPLALLAAGWPGLLPVLGVGVPVAASAWCLERALPLEAAPAPHGPPSAHDLLPHPTHAPERTS